MSTVAPQHEPFAVRRRTVDREPTPPVRATYTREEILDAMRRWYALYGAPPASDDWDPARATRLGHGWRAERFRAGSWPSVRMVRRQFTTFGAAVEAAGFDRPDRPRQKPRLSGPEEVLRAIREWTRRYGEPPVQADWDPARARARGQAWRAARYHDGDWPSLITTRFHFGSLGAAVRAAGVEGGARWEPLDERMARQFRNAQRLAERAARDEGPVGPAVLAGSLRAIAAARSEGDEEALQQHLRVLAESALRWATSSRYVPEDA